MYSTHDEAMQSHGQSHSEIGASPLSQGPYQNVSDTLHNDLGREGDYQIPFLAICESEVLMLKRDSYQL